VDEISLQSLWISLTILLAMSAFFSASETGMMAVNRHQLKHLAQRHHLRAQMVLDLLSRPDRLLGVILICNNLVNTFAAFVGSLIAARLFGQSGWAFLLGPLLLTLLLLVFGEVTPKTFAAYRPQTAAFAAAVSLKFLQRLFAPLLWIINLCSHALLKPFGIMPHHNPDVQLSREELRTLLKEAKGLIPAKHRKMLTSILDLEYVTVDDIMVPKNDIVGIDIDESIDDILAQLSAVQHTFILVFKGSVNQPIAFLHMRKLAQFLVYFAEEEQKTKANLLQHTTDPYYVAAGTPLHTQMSNFQKAKSRIGLVVDEYGDVKGLVTLEDILEEIVGEFTTDLANTSQDIHPQPDGSFIIDGAATIRDINKSLKWSLPKDGPKTLSGLIIEQLEFIPENALCLQLKRYQITVLQVKDNTVRAARVVREEKS
jgi:Mg2+/Co2+ transporter CorB